ncbi:MAG: cytochrome c [Opitutaceae bacterium]|nr:cytochrome c [Opitutaceae bacterium]
MSEPFPPSHAPIERAAASDDSLQRAHAQLLHYRPQLTRGVLLSIGALIAVLLAATLYFTHNAGGFDPLVANEDVCPPKGGFQAVTGPVTPALLGKRVYLANCIQCHQTTGLGVPGTFPPLAGSDWVTGPEERIIRIVLQGANGPITVAGKNFNGVMTPFAPVLKDDEIANVLTYIRSEWGNAAPEVKPETVTRIRSETAGRTAPWAPAELLEIGK